MIHIQSVTKRYQDLLAVDQVSLNIAAGEIFGLLGPNGAGKSSLVNMMCGIIGIDQGDIHIGGHSIRTQALSAKSLLGVVPQELALFEAMTVRENLAYFGELYGLTGKTLKSRVDEALALAQLEDKAKTKVRKLSGGMKRRLNIVCSMLHHPQVLVLDEPTVGIDPHSRNHILDTVKRLNAERGMTIIYITHYMEEVERLCQNIAIIDGGQVLMSGAITDIVDSLTQEQVLHLACTDITTDQLSALSRHKAVQWVNPVDTGLKLGLHKGQEALTATLSLLAETRLHITGMTFERPTLEHAFLKLTGHGLRD